MSGELINLIAILGVGIALATLMFAMFRILDRRIERLEARIERLEARVERLAQDVAEIKGSLNTLHHILRIRVGEQAE